MIDLPVLADTTNRSKSGQRFAFHSWMHVNDRLPTSRPLAEEVARRWPVSTLNHIVRSILGYLQERNLQPGDRLPRACAAESSASAERAARGLDLTTLRVAEARPIPGSLAPRLDQSSFETWCCSPTWGGPTLRKSLTRVRAALEQMAVRPVHAARRRRPEADREHRADRRPREGVQHLR
jgi:hypothetical protein